MDKKYRVILDKSTAIKHEKDLSSILEEKPEESSIVNLANLYNAKSYELVELDPVSPKEGGCVFCYTKTDDLLEDRINGGYLHRSCLVNAIFDNPECPEASKRLYILEETSPKIDGEGK